MKKIVKKWGSSLLISFTEEEQKIYDILEGSILANVEFIVVNDEQKLADHNITRVCKGEVKRKGEGK